MSFEITDFTNDVLKRSATIPVLVDFWAEWCGPCKALSPILERLAASNTDRWVLATVDTDTHQDIAARYGVRGIPNVKLFVDGNVINEFTGLLPEYAITQWLEKSLPNPFQKDIEKASRLIAQNSITEAQAILENVHQKDSRNEDARVLLARTYASEDPARGKELVDGIEEDSPHFLLADAIRTFALIHERAKNPDSLPPDPAKSIYLKGVQGVTTLDFDNALRCFIEVLRINREYDDDGARKGCVAIFKILGEEHEIVQRHRRDFSGALYS